eukprot:1280327-Rhodomonas_salina.3
MGVDCKTQSDSAPSRTICRHVRVYRVLVPCIRHNGVEQLNAVKKNLQRFLAITVWGWPVLRGEAQSVTRSRSEAESLLHVPAAACATVILERHYVGSGH